MRLLSHFAISVAVVAGLSTSYAQKRSTRTQNSSPSTSLAIKTEPNAIVWVDEIRRGVSDTSGKLVMSGISKGRHTVRVRAIGFKEASIPLLPGRGNQLAVHLVRTTDEAELKFQQAEDAREKAKDDDARQQATELYRQALKLRTSFPAAHVGLARTLMDLNKNENALAEIAAAR